MSCDRLVALILMFVVAAIIIAYQILFAKQKSNNHNGDIQSNVDEAEILAQNQVNESLQMDQAGLVTWYNNRVRRHRLTFIVAIIFLSIYFLPFTMVFVYVLIGGLFNGNHNSYVSLGVLLFFVPILIYYFKRKNKEVTDIVKGNLYVELNEKQFPKIWAACYQLMQKMHLSQQLKVYYVKKEAVEASVITKGNIIYLLLSRGMISHSHKKFKDVESIIGHELGHVRQKDARIMLMSKKVISVLVELMFVGLLIGMLFSFLGWGDPTLGKQMLAPTLIYWLFITHRRHAEYLADMASIIFVEKSTIGELIELQMSGNGTFSYPSRSARTSYINRIKLKFTVIN
jgi:Zn-dependent protease with chaperone function